MRVYMSFMQPNGISVLKQTDRRFDENSTLGELYNKYMTAMNLYLVPAMAPDARCPYNKKQRNSLANELYKAQF